ncbi:MAG: hypothetical protein ACK2T3_12925 [Candidatus Promineifilaceae bacterium]|jgi:ABC-type transport system involved in multi-copper enzyme maturation permease subunit
MAKRTKKKKAQRRRTTSEKVIIVLGIIIALSMILSLVVGLGSRGRSNSSSALPQDPWAPIAMQTVGSSEGSLTAGPLQTALSAPIWIAI